jgi:hypothetical protein
MSGAGRSKIRSKYVTPAINLEDLIANSANSILLMDFLETRATHHPYEFRFQDLHSVHVGISNDALHKTSIPGAYFDLGMLFKE